MKIEEKKIPAFVLACAVAAMTLGAAAAVFVPDEIRAISATTGSARTARRAGRRLPTTPGWAAHGTALYARRTTASTAGASRCSRTRSAGGR